MERNGTRRRVGVDDDGDDEWRSGGLGASEPRGPHEGDDVKYESMNQ